MNFLQIIYYATAMFVVGSLGEKCSDDCSCKWKNGKQTVECTDRSLTTIPGWIDSETQVLDMSGNKIKVLPKYIFKRLGLTNLQRLYLRGCHIDRIDSEALAGLTNLVELDLSNNLLTTIPNTSFADTQFLRDLILSHNPIQKVPANALKYTPNLVKLDISNCKINEVDSKAFEGLGLLESLKLNNNKLVNLHPSMFESLEKLTSIALHENPWKCDCHMRDIKIWLLKRNIPTLVAPACRGGPDQLLDKMFSELSVDDFACRPVLLVVTRYAEATIGENASIVCRVSAVPPAQIKWYWNGRMLANHSAFSSFQKILIFEEGQSRKKSTLVLTNAQESDSSEFYCVAENRAGSVEANFTLHVSLRTAGMSTLGSGQIAGISAALVVLILFILLIILVLFIRLRRMPLKEIKSSGGAQDGVAAGNGVVEGGGSSSRRKTDNDEATSFATFTEAKPPASLNLNYVQKPYAFSEDDYTFARYTESHAASGPGPCYSSTTSLMLVENPDLIRDTRRGSADETKPFTSGGYSIEVKNNKLLYSNCIWESKEEIPVGGYVVKDMQSAMTASVDAAQVASSVPPGAKQIRVWQKGVPVLPPVSALKRVLGSTRSSPDEGYQEGTGTDV
ncbi:leucine-rich repeat, immunoglobulin-like domain and transmembrane domain-containing protein 2 [Neodiprion virginianus]|uniref:leucine-rich repeat, immunoglobulin-like domain and transmembrane domain-containing protein 2 n=1 Tax=Neodiprion virginianus TaxID=2961670 RepID=UPI001EE70545|nr:leucine-rich repeat, immunoglobulin-like domain and transmembrane domain-containing protein 2 [Neodiprion virginianus]